MAENTNNNAQANAPVRNDDLLTAVKEMRDAYAVFKEDQNDENRKKLNDANNQIINLTLRATFLVPAVIQQNTQLVQDKQNHLKFQDKPQARFMLVKHKENGTFFPVFTDMDEFVKLENKEGFKAVNMKFSDVATLTEQTPAVDGFVINPVSTNLPYTKEMLSKIKETLIKAREGKLDEAAPADGAAGGITVTNGGAE